MARVFISYSRDDRPKAQSLAEAIADYGHEVWWDKLLMGGADFEDVIEEKLSDVDAIVVLWTETSVKKQWVKAEAGLAVARNNLISLRYSPNLEPPAEFGKYHAEDMSGWDGRKRSAEIEKLIARIDELKSARERNQLADALGPALRVRVQNSNILKILFGLSLPGGLSVYRFTLGAIVCAFVPWLLLLVAGSVTSEDREPATIGAYIFLLFVMAASRGIDQFILVGKGRRCNRFIDKAFSFACAVCVLVAAVVAVAAMVVAEQFDLGAAMALTVYVAAPALLMAYLVRGLMTASKLLHSRV